MTSKTSLTAVVSFSVDYETLDRISVIMTDKRWTRSAAIRILVKYGIIYLKMLEEGYFDSPQDNDKGKVEGT